MPVRRNRLGRIRRAARILEWRNFLMKSRILIVLFWFWVGLVGADEIALNPNHPESYTVVRGDTLWDISGKFLQHPWQWPEIWHENPQIKNPHWIYPGDELVLSYVNGKPRLTVGRPSEVRLSPEVRISPLDQAIPTIPVNTIRQFLTKPKVVAAGALDSSPYVVAFPDDRIVGGAGDNAFVKGIDGERERAFFVFRAGPAYKDGETGEILGYEALYVGNADLVDVGDPAVVVLKGTQRECLVGDRLLPVEADKVVMNYYPHPPKHFLRGHIVGLIDGVTQIGQYQIVIIDRGAANGVDEGTVLDIRQSGKRKMVNLYNKVVETVDLPEQKSGELLIFKAYDRVSYGLVMEATRALHLLDTVQQP
jgi:hypothetical protein